MTQNAYQTAAYCRAEEIWSASIHGAGIIFGVAACALLAVFSSIYADAWSIVGTSIFGASIIVMYTASTLYHAATSPRAKRVLKRFDHISIYYLIAGSYTPFLLVTLRGTTGWVIFGIIWALAITGTVLKLVSDANGAKAWSVSMYLAMGWLVIFVIGSLIEKMPFNALVFLALGGLMYTAGVFFYMKKSKKFTHAIWHFFVLAGTVFHFFAVLFSCVFY